MSDFSLVTFKVPLTVGSAASQIFKAKHFSFLSWLLLRQEQTRIGKVQSNGEAGSSLLPRH